MSLRFGIPQLDILMEIPAVGASGRHVAPSPDPTSMAILGPDGSGKSVLALHLASRYLADCVRWWRTGVPEGAPLPLVLYVSSDFNYSGANKVWKEFGLGKPEWRDIPGERMSNALERAKHAPIDPTKPAVELTRLTPDGDDVVNYLETPHKHPSQEPCKVGFLDLATQTAGDDWHYVNGILAKLGSIPRFGFRKRRETRISSIPHLVIVDSVAGFETFIGTVDAYGLEQSRRARIAQSLRHAGRNCHLVFVVEEPRVDERLPEEYVTDIVLRLRSRKKGGMNLRTIEIEKARSRNHALGEHPYQIRGKEGSSTGSWENVDMPQCNNAHVQVFRSLAHRNFITARRHSSGTPSRHNTVARFGIDYLDDLLVPGEAVLSGNAAAGLVTGTASALIGDSSTGKNMLAQKFLLHSYLPILVDALTVYHVLTQGAGKPRDLKLLEAVAKQIAEPTIDGPPYNGRKHFAGKIREQSHLLPTFRRAWAWSEKSSNTIYQRKDKASPEELRQVIVMLWKAAVHGGSAPCSRAESGRRAKLWRDLDWSSSSQPAQAIEVIRDLLRHPNLRLPGILLTTADVTTYHLAENCWRYLIKPVQERVPWFAPEKNRDHQKLQKALTDLLQEQLIVRRFDSAPFSPEELFHLIEQNVIAAHYMVHSPAVPRDNVRRAKRGNRIRLVIDDLRVLASLCPGIQEDSSFLSHLHFWLEREGVTSLLVLTDALKPYKQATDPITAVLQPLVDRAILTWGVGFEGRNRIAISVVPASKRELNGIVRELELPQASENHKTQWEYPKVNRYFELYTGVEEEKPRRVPLAVYLFNSGLGTKAYLDAEEILYRQRFLPLEGGTVLRGLSSREYFAWRDYSHLKMDAQSDHTTLFQVDGFWSLDPGRGTLAPQGGYLKGPANDLKRAVEDTDHFKLFDPLEEKNYYDPKEVPQNRKAYFRNSQFECRVPETNDEDDMPDRVPFMWDFGFLLVNANMWRAARNQPLDIEGTYWRRYWPKSILELASVDEITVNRIKNKISEKPLPQVEDIRKALREIRPPEEREKPSTALPWRFFFGAAQRVAEHCRMHFGHADVTAFDFASPTPEGLNTLFLEIWFSEMMLENNRAWKKNVLKLSVSMYTAKKSFSLAELLRDGLEPVTPVGARRLAVIDNPAKPAGPFLRKFNELKLDWEARKGEGGTRLDELPAAVLCLYKTWLLLLDVMDFEVFFDGKDSTELRTPKKAATNSMAVRHWYVTACDAQLNDAEKAGDAPIPLRMPGHFSTRGDTFLAMTKDSRSRLLADYALDLLSSRRANLTRMRSGMGLPVRDVLASEACNEMPTALVCRVPAERGIKPTAKYEIKYGQLCSFGGVYADQLDEKGELPQKTSAMPPLWLFRAGIKDYDRISRPLNKWLISLIHWTIARKRRIGAELKSGLKEYDSIMNKEGHLIFDGPVTAQFFELCDLLMAELQAAERKT